MFVSRPSSSAKILMLLIMPLSFVISPIAAEPSQPSAHFPARRSAAVDPPPTQIGRSAPCGGFGSIAIASTSLTVATATVLLGWSRS